MLHHMADLAMYRQGDPGPHPLVDPHEFVTRGMAGDMDTGVAVGDDLDAACHQRILQASDGALVSGNDTRREDRRVALLQDDVAVLVIGDLGHRRPHLALAAGADEQHLVLRQIGPILRTGAFGKIEHVAAFLRRLDHAQQRRTRQHRMTARRDRGQRNAFHARKVGSKAGDRNAPSPPLDQLLEIGSHHRLGARFALDEDVGAVADHRQHTLITDALQHRLVGQVADQRFRIDLPVTGVKDGAELGPDGKPIRLEDRMRHGDHLEVERPETELAAQRDFRDPDGIDQPGLRELPAQHRGRERSGVDRGLQPRPEIGHRAQMILMRVSQHDADQVLAPLLDESRIGHDDLDARHGVVAECDTEIEHQPFTGMAVEIEVHADLAGTAQCEKQEFVGRWNGHFLLRL